MDQLFTRSAGELFRLSTLPAFADAQSAVHMWNLTLVTQGVSIKDAMVCFRRYDGAGDAAGCCAADNSALGAFGCLSQCYAEEFCHVELAFNLSEAGTQRLVAWTVDLYNSRVVGSGTVRTLLRDRPYKPGLWEVHSLAGHFSDTEIAGLFAYCLRQQGKPINSAGLKLNFLPVLRWFSGTPLVEETTYFCSQLVASALRWVRPTLFATLDPRRATPLGIYLYLCDTQLISTAGPVTDIVPLIRAATTTTATIVHA